MSAALVLYLINILNNLDITIGLLIGLGGLFCIVCIPICGHAWELEKNELLSRWLNRFKIASFFLLLLMILDIFIPSPKTMYMMAGTKYLNDTQIPSKVIELLNQKLDKELKGK